MSRRVWIPLAAALLAFFFFQLLRGWPPSLAAILGLAIGALVWAVQRTTDRLRAMSRRD